MKHTFGKSSIYPTAFSIVVAGIAVTLGLVWLLLLFSTGKYFVKIIGIQRAEQFVNETYETNLELSSPHFRIFFLDDSAFVGTAVAIDVWVDTGGEQVNEAGVILRYPPQELLFRHLEFADRFVNTTAATDVALGGVLLTSEFDEPEQGTFRLARLVFQAQQQGAYELWFDCSKEIGNTDIVVAGEDKVNCMLSNQSTHSLQVLPAREIGGLGTCAEVAPLPPQLFVESGSTPGTVHLWWERPPNTREYSIQYGVTNRNYTYGVPLIEGVNEYTILYLVPGQQYYFVMQAHRGCAISELSNEVSALASLVGEGLVREVDQGSTTLLSEALTDPSPQNSLVSSLIQELSVWQRMFWGLATVAWLFGVTFVLLLVLVVLIHTTLREWQVTIE